MIGKIKRIPVMAVIPKNTEIPFVLDIFYILKSYLI